MDSLLRDGRLGGLVDPSLPRFAAQTGRRTTARTCYGHRGGRWQPTGIRDAVDPAVLALAEQFGWMLEPMLP